MTNDRAVEMLNAIIFLLDENVYSDDVEEAIHMAIKALTTQPEKTQLSEEDATSDCISRQAAIDAVSTMFAPTPTQKDMVEDCLEILENLPSAQPDSKELSFTHKALDTISRQAAIDACIRVREYRAYDEIEEIKALPSAQPEPIRINLNEPIKVKLTDWGKEIYYHQYDRTNQIAGREICKPRFPREDENGYTEFQLWCFIELYGMHMGMTLPNVIEPLEIVYER